ncbi:MAG: hypothetical protein AB1295_02265 [Candidatus Micrarchaeota archaeon]
MPKSGPAPAGKEGKVLQFPDRKRQGDVMADRLAPVDRRKSLAFLGSYAQVPKSMEDVLAIPDTLYLVESDSLSSDRMRSLMSAAGALAYGGAITPEMIKELPDYGIHVIQRGNTAFCLFLDRSRKVMVWESLGNALGGDLSWGFFESSLRRALDDAKGRKGAFTLILYKESTPEKY